jgi:hypothetical protein
LPRKSVDGRLDRGEIVKFVLSRVHRLSGEHDRDEGNQRG